MKGPISPETIRRLQKISEEVRTRRSATGPQMHRKFRERLRDLEACHPLPTSEIQAAAFPGATPGMNWQHLLYRTAEPLFTEGAEAEEAYWRQGQRIVEQAQEGWHWMLAQELAKIVLEEVDLHEEHGEIHNPYLRSILEKITAGEIPVMPKRIGRREA